MSKKKQQAHILWFLLNVLRTWHDSVIHHNQVKLDFSRPKLLMQLILFTLGWIQRVKKSRAFWTLAIQWERKIWKVRWGEKMEFSFPPNGWNPLENKSRNFIEILHEYKWNIILFSSQGATAKVEKYSPSVSSNILWGNTEGWDLKFPMQALWRKIRFYSHNYSILGGWRSLMI